MAWLDPILGWTLHLHPLLGVLLLSLIVTLIINIITKYATNQSEMKRLKEEIDGFKKKMKEHKDNPKEMMKVNQKAMEVNMQYMKHSFRGMLFTLVPILFIFGWMNANYTYAPLDAGDPLLVNAHFLEGFDGTAVLTSPTLGTSNSSITQKEDENVANFAITGDPGVHQVTLQYQKFSYNATVWLGEKPKQTTFEGKGPLEKIDVQYPRIRPLGSFNMFGWHPGWLSIYIVFSILLSIGLRKVMKVY